MVTQYHTLGLSLSTPSLAKSFVLAYVRISSTEGVARAWGELLGQYEYVEDKECFVQSSTEQSAGKWKWNGKYKARYLYRDEVGDWVVGHTPGGNILWLWNTNFTSEKLPTGGWMYSDGETSQYDPSLTVTPGPLPPLPNQFIVTASGEFVGLTNSLKHLGVFDKTERWWSGRSVYVNTQGVFLYHDESWMIADEFGYYVLRGSQFHQSPADERTWTYLEETSYAGYTSSKVEKPASVSVREGKLMFFI